ncbi:beta-sandwich domain-containing protein [Bdellovibrio bacteriovorus]|uniref:beta-sandwich domain-containing protein n=1 Tax=Bdellovibrio bacteriovorus TaxID=959 RepID=UPI0021D231E1|nr:beta-sandwich domain-containing protein [Bdellovibrio bacteriovorus]UXR65190.1 beta-sandwich domain-containing protein [Bdellovibrio bacteriovorus]
MERKVVATVLLALTMMQTTAYAQVISDLPVPGGSEVQAQVQSGPRTPPPPVTENINRHYADVANLDQISRKSGGEPYRFHLAQPTQVRYLELTVRASRVKIHEATVTTTRGQRFVIREFNNSDVLSAGALLTSENLNLNDDVRMIELRMESYSQPATIALKAIGNNSVPRLTVQRPVSAPPVTPSQPSRPVDTRLKAGDQVVSVSASTRKVYDGRVVEAYQNGKVLVRDADDGKTYVRDQENVHKRISCNAGRVCEGEEVMAYPIGEGKAYSGRVTAVYTGDLVKMRDADDGKEYYRASKLVHRKVNCLESLCAKDRVVSVLNDKVYFGSVVAVYSNGLLQVRDDDDGKTYPRKMSAVSKEVKCGMGFCRGDRVLSQGGSGRYYAGRVESVYANGLVGVRDDDDGKVYSRHYTKLSRAR